MMMFPDPTMINFVFEGSNLNIGINGGLFFPVAQLVSPH
jgi:hypothetical protein